MKGLTTTITPTTVLIVIAVVFFIWFFAKSSKIPKFAPNPSGTYVEFLNSNAPKVLVEIADTEAKRAKGLMFRTSLPENSGMFFIFPFSSKYAFWMANTKIPLDIIWLDEDFTIVDISKNTPPCTETGAIKSLCTTYPPKAKARYVLEVNGGFCDKYLIKISDKLRLL